jgi:UDP-glucose 4-epimerase
MTILVTGSAGHLGEALQRRLRSAGERSIGLDLKPSPFTDVVGSIADRALVRDSLRGVTAVLHTATLHKPHIATHTRQQFIDTNISGTLNLLEEALAAGVAGFVLTSSTSVFGHALRPGAGEAARWITEEVAPQPRNIYGITKLAAEQLCELFQRQRGLPCVLLRAARFFPEQDDEPTARQAYASDNLKVNEYLYRRADIEDVARAHLLAAEQAPALGFARYVISATTPFLEDELPQLRSDAASVVKRHVPGCEAVFRARGWRLPEAIERVYVNARARRELGWHPLYDFSSIIERLARSQDYRSELAREVGSKGYHAERFAEGPYPTEEVVAGARCERSATAVASGAFRPAR